ncbi:MAG: hypothetical protein GY762_09955 [Proteobacteria bacterium]|nr:hypothetical protein [Pseudomonadota bacterium]
MLKRTQLFLFLAAYTLCIASLAEDQTSDNDQDQAADKEQLSDKTQKGVRKDIRTDAVMQQTQAVQPVTGVENMEKKQPKVEFVPGRGLQIMSSDRKFRLTTTLFGEFLYTFTHDRISVKNTQSVQLRRVRLVFTGNWFGEHNKFFLQLALSPRDMQFEQTYYIEDDGTRGSGWVGTKSPVFDFIFQFDYLRDLSFQFGQYRVPYSLQRRVPFSKLQFVDRSVANFEFNLDRSIGANIYSKDFLGLNLLRYYLGVFTGEGRDSFQDTDFGLLYCARITVMPLGLFDNHIEADLARHKKPVLAIGVGYAFIDNAQRNQGVLGNVPADGGTTDMHNVTMDVSFKFNGLSFFGDFYFRDGTRDDGTAPGEDPRNGIGWATQAGYLVPKIPFEMVFRYSQVLPIGDQTSIIRTDEVGGCLNWYIFGTSLVLATDYLHQFPGGTLDSGQDQLRVKFQGQF